MRISLKRIIIKVIAYCFPPKYSYEEKLYFLWCRYCKGPRINPAKTNFESWKMYQRRRGRFK